VSIIATEQLVSGATKLASGFDGPPGRQLFICSPDNHVQHEVPQKK